ncbi:MarR family winged helix-turn-helix transcriptional regulator [Secundilactobacillus hailunensis]|uniref:MarR family winged helix-turn-helix transcriptional regulator n=1 Tax=Secundilactobacillus hailunensis TaxID=2559923 RepID=A0ABW1T7U0_9LACO|nr:MarR family winged helix-turn-helix transcriptional regulator [Secundilactobacillus hailunensis]
MASLGIGISIGVFSRKTQAFMKAVIKKMGLKEVDAIILINVQENPGIIQDQIGHNLSVDNAMVARSLKRMEADELIKRVVDENNQRTKQVYIEPAGTKYVTQITDEMQFWDSIILEGLSDQEKTTLAANLVALKDRAEQIDIEAVLAARKDEKK